MKLRAFTSHKPLTTSHHSLADVPVELGSPVSEEVVVGVELLVERFCGVDVEHAHALLVFAGPRQDVPRCVRNLALPRVMKALVAPLLRPRSIRRDGKYAVFQASRDHGRLTVGKNEVGGVADDLGPLQGEGPHGFRKKPVEADHDPNPARPYVVDGKLAVTRVEPELLLEKEMHLAVARHKSLRRDQDRGIEDLLPAALGHPRNEMD